MGKVKDNQNEYRFCSTCKKLSPCQDRIDDNIECMVCGTIIVSLFDFNTGGRPVFLSPYEAELRGLRVPPKSDGELL